MVFKKLDLYSLIRERHNQPKRCAIFGNFGALNLGDEAILSGELEQLLKIEKLKVTVVAKYPEIVKSIHGVDAVYFLNILQVLKVLLDSEFVMVGGGGLFCKSSSGINGKLFQLYFILLFILFPKVIGKKVYVLGIGIYENMGSVLLFLSSLTLKLADYISVRDAQSQKILIGRNVKSDLYVDNSNLMTLPDNSGNRGNSILFVDSENINIGLALKYPKAPNERKVLVSAILRFIEKHKDAHFWFYSLDSNTFIQSDVEFNELIITTIKNRKITQNFHLVPSNYHPKDIFSTFKEMDFFVAMRLHSMIFCDRLGVNFFGITYDSKCSSFLLSVGKTPHEIDESLYDKLELDFSSGAAKSNHNMKMREPLVSATIVE